MAASESVLPTYSAHSTHAAYLATLVPPSKQRFDEIAQVQAEKEGSNRRKLRQQQQMAAVGIEMSEAQGQDAAARMIQKTFRGYRARREMDGFSLNPTTRWVTAVRDAQFREAHRPRPLPLSPSATGEADDAGDADARPLSSSARQNWRKAGMAARRAGRDDSDCDSESEPESGTDESVRKANRVAENAKRRTEARTMGLQYFLEMVDLKHRYGSNLQVYHEEWKRSNVQENFFYWLDHGAGRNIELEACPRDQLEREQVRYLSREERQFYLVKVDADGRLCWAKNGVKIDTTEQFKDSIHGIVPADDETPAFNAASNTLTDGDDNDSDSSAESKREAERAAKYATPEFDNTPGMKRVRHLTASTVFNKLLRKTVRKNTWIFVADTSFRLYVGIKDSGAFQHSSFLQGGRISAAGCIRVKNGRLQSLSPLSGHYRPPSSNFRAFLKSLKAEGVDLSHMSVSKSYAVLVGLETYVKTTKKSKDVVDKIFRTKDKGASTDKPVEKKFQDLSV